MRYLGIDYGKKRVGLSLSDEDGRIAFPLFIVQNDKKLFSEIEKVVKKENISKIVIGESVNNDGLMNEVMGEINNFKTKIENNLGLEVFFQKEFFTSLEARRFQGGGSGVDASASAIILQRFLDKNNK